MVTIHVPAHEVDRDTRRQLELLAERARNRWWTWPKSKQVQVIRTVESLLGPAAPPYLAALGRSEVEVIPVASLQGTCSPVGSGIPLVGEGL